MRPPVLNAPLAWICDEARAGRQGSGVATTAIIRADANRSVPPSRRNARRSPFHATVALIIAASMIAGFYFDLSKYVIHPTVRFPGILAFHSAVFVAWMLVYLAQTLLIQARQVRVHRTLGWFGLALALVMPPLGIATAVIMRRFDLLTFHSHDVPRDLAFLATPLADILAFTPCAWLGLAFRKRSDVHSRLMFLAIATVAETGFGRLPIPGATKWFFLSNLAFYTAAIVHDRLTLGYVHKAYKMAVPLIVLDEAFAMYLWLAHPAWWLAVCRQLTGLA
jgi:hypothetical protein